MRKIVVVIDDHPATLDGMSSLLESWGYDVVAAPTDEAALDRLAAHDQRPDLIISDYRLSEGKLGTQAIDRLRNAFEIPALLITGDVNPIPEHEMHARHCQLIHKPADTIALRAILNQIGEHGN